MKKKQNVINIGCRLNSFESSIIKRILDSNTIKNKVVVNTCAVTNQAVKRSISAIKKAKSLGFRCNVNCTIFDYAEEESMRSFLDFVTNELNVDGITISPGFAEALFTGLLEVKVILSIVGVVLS